MSAKVDNPAHPTARWRPWDQLGAGFSNENFEHECAMRSLKSERCVVQTKDTVDKLKGIDRSSPPLGSTVSVDEICQQARDALRCFSSKKEVDGTGEGGERETSAHHRARA